MDILKQPAWWIPLFLVPIHQFSQYVLGLDLGLIDDYLDPILCLPVLLGLWLTERRVFFRVDRLTGLEIMVASLILSFVFEEIFPRFQPDFVRDWWDYLAYAAGAVWFWWMINPAEEDVARSQDAEKDF